MSKQAVINITDKLGADAICSGLSVTNHSVRHARFTGAFPAAWYRQLKEMCEAEGIDCPLSAFNFKSPTSRPSAEAS